MCGLLDSQEHTEEPVSQTLQLLSRTRQLPVLVSRAEEELGSGPSTPLFFSQWFLSFLFLPPARSV